jgi:hypothetical protein
MPVRRHLAVPAVIGALLVSASTAAVTMTGAGAAGGGSGGSVSIAALTPPNGPAGTEIAYSLAGTDDAGAAQCANSSAYRLELLGSDGTLATTGGSTVAVPPGTPAGKAYVRLVCYIPDATGRRVIYGLCGRFDVTDGATAATTTSKAAVSCPATPRVTFGQSVVAVEREISQAFNPQLYYPIPK